MSIFSWSGKRAQLADLLPESREASRILLDEHVDELGGDPSAVRVLQKRLEGDDR